eukprot:COSAG05_NODE_1796_length_4073_cov_2.160292_5_plen_160_part_00
MGTAGPSRACYTLMHTDHIRRSSANPSLGPQAENRLETLMRIWRALHEHVKFVHGPEKQYRSLPTAYRPHLWPVCWMSVRTAQESTTPSGTHRCQWGPVQKSAGCTGPCTNCTDSCSARQNPYVFLRVSELEWHTITLRVRVDIFGHFKPCMTEIYLHI